MKAIKFDQDTVALSVGGVVLAVLTAIYVIPYLSAVIPSF